MSKSILAVIRDYKYFLKCVIIDIIYLSATITKNNYLD